MTLGEKQRKFTRLIADLVIWAYANGYELTYGDAYRSLEQAKANAILGSGIANSLHTQRLAVDFNLFINGVYQTDSEAYRPLGEHWKSLHEDCCWGGDFTKKDGNHFSFTHGGIK